MTTDMNNGPMIFGEVLFDCFPDGSRVAGGAPFNVAWHLQGFGLQPLFISRIGKDDAGSEILTMMRDWGMNSTGIQLDSTYPTGQVAITLQQDGQPAFEIVPDQAYDYIDVREQMVDAAVTAPLVYHGSLAMRNSTSRETCHAICERSRGKIFIDINLRAPWWKMDDVSGFFDSANIVKLNDEELGLVSGRKIDKGNQQEAATELFQEHDLEMLIVTCGENGAWILTENEVIKGEPVPADGIVDTVGAGDAFSAVTIYGLQRGWPEKQILDRALAFASAVCEIRGATSRDRRFYRAFLEKWEK